MAEAITVRGIEGHAELAGPPTDPPSHTLSVPPWDQLNEGVVVPGDPDATALRYFIEKTSPELADIVTRVAEEPEEEE